MNRLFILSQGIRGEGKGKAHLCSGDIRTSLPKPPPGSRCRELRLRVGGSKEQLPRGIAGWKVDICHFS